MSSMVTETAERNLTRNCWVISGGIVPRHVGIDKAGGDGVHGDLLLRQFAGGDFGQGDDARLAGGVVGLAKETGQGGQG